MAEWDYVVVGGGSAYRTDQARGPDQRIFV